MSVLTTEELERRIANLEAEKRELIARLSEAKSIKTNSEPAIELTAVKIIPNDVAPNVWPPVGITHVDTKTAAKVLGFKEQTLRQWHHHNRGPIQPIVVATRLKWAVSDISKVLGVAV